MARFKDVFFLNYRVTNDDSQEIMHIVRRELYCQCVQVILIIYRNVMWYDHILSLTPVSVPLEQFGAVQWLSHSLIEQKVLGMVAI